MKIQYIGKYPASTDGIGEHKPGDIVEVDAEYGNSLIRQRNWQKPVMSQPKKGKEAHK